MSAGFGGSGSLFPSRSSVVIFVGASVVRAVVGSWCLRPVLSYVTLGLGSCFIVK
ncbi:hypothetical protein A2U01_0003931 [Trifolium medium]|uniref:Uncharacterized protein n=1 Tax=Trifolium medium TaxID=97028 RepID=A0A392M6U9_9FABA|nr:hypothetical protein [Trifolium medium]